MIQNFAQRLMDLDVEGLCDAGYGERTAERLNHRNGYRAESVELQIPTLRKQGQWTSESRGSRPYRAQWIGDPAVVVARRSKSPVGWKDGWVRNAIGHSNRWSHS